MLVRVRDVMRETTATHAEQPEHEPAPAHLAPPSLPPGDLPQLEAEARYHRDRLRLYHARVVSSKPTSLGELRELKRISTAADERLAHARTR